MNSIKNILLFLFAGSQLSTMTGQEKVVPFAFGDMDQWVVREIQESGIIGGNKSIFMNWDRPIRLSVISLIITGEVHRGRTPM